jgi:hypothetical protein
VLNNAQRRFLKMHRDRFVKCWQAVLGGGMVRATDDHGHTATLSTDEIADLIADGLMLQGIGLQLSITEAGRQV